MAGPPWQGPNGPESVGSNSHIGLKAFCFLFGVKVSVLWSLQGGLEGNGQCRGEPHIQGLHIAHRLHVEGGDEVHDVGYSKGCDTRCAMGWHH